jgi:hypothetical protein
MGDDDLLLKYHLAPMSLIDAVKSTFGMIASASKIKKLTYYKVLYNKQPIGYTVTFDNNLYSYAINKKFRKKDILVAWWNEIKETLSDNFMSMLYSNNERAKNFLIKNGMKVFDEKDNVITFINSQTKETCPLR